MYLSSMRLTFTNSGNISNSENFDDSLGCACNFPPIEEWEDQRCGGQRARVRVKLTAGEDCVKLFTRPLNHKLLTFSSVLYFLVLVLLKWHHCSKSLHLHNVNNALSIMQFAHVSYFTCSLITEILFHHCIRKQPVGAVKSKCFCQK